MRAVAIFGPGCTTQALRPFQKSSDAIWLSSLPQHSDQVDAILIFGGDGTVHRHLAQLVNLQLPVLVVPCGSGNDFARALNLFSVCDSLSAWRNFSAGANNLRAIDLGLITPTNLAAASGPHYFCCVGGVGLDADIARRANRLPRWLRRHGGYVLSFPPALFSFAPISVEVMVPDAEHPDALVARGPKPTVVAAFANAPGYGGGMKIAPHARMDDGKLDICVIGEMDKFKVFCLFPTIYFGRHLSIPQVEYFQTERLWLETGTPLDVYADGEYVCKSPIEVRVARNSLKVVVP